MLLKDYKIEQENNMAIEKIGMFSSAINSGLLEAGHRSGFDVALAGAGLGAAGGAINGSFSDYEGVFSGAMKGAVVGGLTGTGLKAAGSRYAKNYDMKVGQLTNDNGGPLKFGQKGFKEQLEFDPGLLRGGMDEGDSWFNGSFGNGASSLRDTAREFSFGSKTAGPRRSDGSL